MILVAKATFPQTSVKQAAMLYGKLQKLPAAIRRHGPYFKVETGSEIDMVAVYETDSAAVMEVKKYLEKRFATFTTVPGFTYTLEEWSTLVDGLNKLASMSRSTDR